MDQDQFQEIMMRLLKTGIRIVMFLDKETIWFDLDTGMKSHLHVRFDPEKQAIAYKARYNEFGWIDDWEDLKMVARKCMHGHDYASAYWHEILTGEYEFQTTHRMTHS